MGAKDELLKILGVRSDDDAAALALADAADSDSDTTVIVATADTDTDTNDDVIEPNEALVRSVVDVVDKELQILRTAIESVDGVIRTMAEVQQEHAELLAGMAATETVRTQRALADGDWLGSLYTASRSSDAPEVDADDIKASGGERGDATGWELISGSVQ